ncbi:hypothetical protein GSI_13626 [Ganoderma sinense ZZ0214-1]|uniref:Uncharacterized protein n=1 Tax=Ganoderma sinense ZZ0214-1 TaxID=1077348 RepID=A0A2G8RQT3_9APHY|nr:hypothetical protein GSI_13626 [Ganoderma sinense ZZ0214-1]
MSFMHKVSGKVSQDEGPTSAPEKILKEFIAEDPNSTYTFDSERGAPLSELCREGEDKGRKCIMVCRV